MTRRTKLLLLPLLLTALVAACWVLASLTGIGLPLLLLVVFSAIVLGVGVLYARMIVAARTLAALNQDAVAMVNQGRVREGLVAFESCAEKARAARLPGYAMLFQANAASALVELGRPERAVSTCRALEQEPDVRRSLAATWGHFVGTAATAKLLVADADIDATEAYLDRHAPDVSQPQRALLLTPRVIILLRRGRHAEVDPLLSERWLEAEGVLPARRLRRLRLLWAFALHEAGRAEDARERLNAAGPTAVEETEPLTRGWPSLAAYLAGLQGYRASAR
ncbi:MAG: hypothetical protein AAGA54_28185 [Myxococcota bacterium]